MCVYKKEERTKEGILIFDKLFLGHTLSHNGVDSSQILDIDAIGPQNAKEIQRKEIKFFTVLARL